MKKRRRDGGGGEETRFRDQAKAVESLERESQMDLCSATSSKCKCKGSTVIRVPRSRYRCNQHEGGQTAGNGEGGPASLVPQRFLPSLARPQVLGPPSPWVRLAPSHQSLVLTGVGSSSPGTVQYGTWPGQSALCCGLDPAGQRQERRHLATEGEPLWRPQQPALCAVVIAVLPSVLCSVPRLK